MRGTRLLLAAAFLGAAAAPAAATARVPVRQEVATLITTHESFPTLDDHATHGATVTPRRPLTGGATAFPVLGHGTDRSGVPWLHVMLPGRPNGRSGWIREAGTAAGTTPWHIVVATAARRVRVYRSGRLVRTFSAIVGKPATPTPRGRFFVEESIELPAGSAGAPFALALSARSEVLQEFEGGPGQIALHGVRNLPGALGTAASHGCVRLSDRGITWLAHRITPGVPVTVLR